MQTATKIIFLHNISELYNKEVKKKNAAILP